MDRKFFLGYITQRLTSLCICLSILLHSFIHPAIGMPGRDKDQAPHSSSTSRILLRTHCDLLVNWAPLAGTKILSRSGIIHAQFKFNTQSTKNMAASELIFPAQKLLTRFSVSWIESIEDHIANEKGKYLQALAQSDFDMADVHARKTGEIVNSAALGSVASAIPVILGMLTLVPALKVYGYNPELLGPLGEYFGKVVWGIPIRHLCFVYNNFLITQGYVKSAIAISRISFLTPALNEFFMSSPNQSSFSGMAIATSIEAGIMLCGYFTVFRLNPDFEKFHLFRPKIDLEMMWKIAKDGIPISIKRVLEAISPFLITQFIMPDNKDILAASSLMNQILIYSTLAISMVSKTINVAMRSSTKEDVYRVGLSGVVQSNVLFGGFLLFFYSYPEYVTSFWIDLDNPEYYAQRQHFESTFTLQLLTHYLFIQGTAIASNLRGMNQLTETIYSDVLTTWGVSIPLSYILVNYYDYGYVGALMGPFVASICQNLYLHSKWITAGFGSYIYSNAKDLLLGSERSPSLFGRAKNTFNRWFGEKIKDD